MLTNDIETLVAAMLRDIDDVTDPLQDYNAIGLAVMRLSIDKPHCRVEDVTVVSSRLAELPSLWVTGFSALKRVEYPIDETPRAFIDDAELYTSPVGEKVDLFCGISGDVRMTYTVPYVLDVLDETLTTVPEKFKEPLASYVVHLLLNQLAANYSHSSDGIIKADSVDHGDKSRKFSSLAKVHLKKYEDQVGIEKPKEQGAAGVINWDRQRIGLPYARRQ
jgi:hypothetical protein